jgi:hypothetical protein
MALLDTNPLAQLFGQEQYGQMKNEALNMGALNAIAQLLAASGPQARPVGTGQAIGNALLGGYQGYQSSMDRALGDMLKASQIQELVGKQKSREALKGAYKQQITPEVSIGAMTSQDPVARQLMQENMAMGDTGLESLARSANYAVQGTAQEAQPVVKQGVFDPTKFAQSAIASGANPEDVNAFIKSVQGERTKLGQGDVLVDASGKVVAKGEAKPEKVDTGNGTAFVDPSTYKVIGFVPKTKDGSVEDDKLRTSFLNQAKPHIEITQAYRKIVSAPDTAPGDMSKIFGYMKILDPGSTVREGEYASAENARGVPDSIKAMYNKVIDGTRLTGKQRGEFDSAANALVESQKGQFDQIATFYSNTAKRQGANPENIIYNPYQDLPTGKKTAETPLPSGVVVAPRALPAGASQALGLPEGASVVVRKR